MIKEYKNFLTKEQHESLFKYIQNEDFPWYHVQDEYKDSTLNYTKFSHILYHSNTIRSEHWEQFIPLFNTLNIQMYHRIKLNLTLKEEEEIMLGSYHHDYMGNVNANDYSVTAPLKELKIAIYYFNETNGETLIKENGKIKKIKCEENKLVTFSNTLEHVGMSHTDTQFRYILNINYI